MNTTDAALHGELGDIWRDVDRDPSVNAVILTGAGKVFSRAATFRSSRRISTTSMRGPDNGKRRATSSTT